MSFNLTSGQKELLVQIVGYVRAGQFGEEFSVLNSTTNPHVIADGGFAPVPSLTQGKLEALSNANLLHLTIDDSILNVTLLGSAYDAVDNNFDAPDVSFLTHLTPLTDITGLDAEIKQRVLPLLAAGPSDPKVWDSAVRTVSVILEDRLRNIANINDGSIGKGLVNKAFGSNGTLASKLKDDSERESYRDLFAGVVGLIRNPSAHRLIDPDPSEGGVLIVFVNLLLNKLEALR